MSGLRKYRASIYFYSATKSGGITTAKRTRQKSTSADGNWWVSRGVPDGSEPTVGMAPEDRVGSIIGALTEVPINENAVIVIEGEALQHRVIALLPRSYGRAEWQALCEVVPAQRYALSEPA